MFNKIYPDDEGIFIIPGLQLAENVKIDLNLAGVQHLDDGVYVFENKTWQDFITLSKLENEVNFTMQMEFNVTDPGTADVKKTSKSWEETKDVAYEKTESGSRKVDGTETTQLHAERTEIYGKITIVETETKKTVKKAEWRNYYRLVNTNDEDGDGTGGAGFTIPEEPVPLAAPPQTGDISGLWIGLILFAAVALYVTNENRKKSKNEAN